MPRWSELRIGGVAFRWRFNIQSRAALLFDPADFQSRPERREAGDRWFDFLGYETSVREALASLDAAGFTMEFFASVWESLRPRIDAEFLEALEDDVCARYPDDEVERRLAEYRQRFPEQDAAGELREFVAWLREALDGRMSDPAFDEDLVVAGRRVTAGEQFGERGEELVEIEAIRAYVIANLSLFPPSVGRVLGQFGDEFFLGQPEVALLMLARLLLEASPPGAGVALDLTDVVTSVEEARGEHSQVAEEIAMKAALSDRVAGHLGHRVPPCR